MRSTILVPAWVTLASAQLLTTSQLQSIPAAPVQLVPAGASGNIIPYNGDAAYANAFNSYSSGVTRRRRSPLEQRTIPNCEQQALGSGPTPDPDTDTAFLASTAFSDAANNAQTPSGWTLAFQNKQASVSTSGYQGFKTYGSYNPALCAADCLASSGCQSFNIFFERDMTLAAAPACPNPPSTTVIKCSFWGAPVLTEASLTNVGQFQQQFHTVQAGSNGYQLSAPSYSVPSYNTTSTGSATINAPNECNSYITYKSYTGTYDPNLCAAACAAQRLETNPFRGLKCRFFSSYQLIKNGNIQAQICSLYSRTWDSSYATNTGYTDGADTYTISNAVSGTLSSDIGDFSCNSYQQPSPTTTTSITTSQTTLSTITTTSVSSSSTITTTSTSPSSSTTSTTRSTSCSTTQSSTPIPSTPANTNIKSCPSGNNFVASKNGLLFNTCPGTDYKIPRPSTQWNVPTLQACVDICGSCSTCIKSVYDPVNKVCWSQTSTPVDWTDPVWIIDPRFTTVKKVADGTPIDKCYTPGPALTATCNTKRDVLPVTEAATSPLEKRTLCIFLPWLCQQPSPQPQPQPQKKNFQVCQKTDYYFPNQQTWWNVKSELDCANLCAKTNGCKRASYVFANQGCFGKGSGGQNDNLIWTTGTNSYFNQ